MDRFGSLVLPRVHRRVGREVEVWLAAVSVEAARPHPVADLRIMTYQTSSEMAEYSPSTHIPHGNLDRIQSFIFCVGRMHLYLAKILKLM